VSPVKTAEPMDMPFGGLSAVGSKNHLLDEVQIAHGEEAIFGVVRPIEKHWESLMRCTTQIIYLGTRSLYSSGVGKKNVKVIV